jgi:hypothetical protein
MALVKTIYPDSEDQTPIPNSISIFLAGTIEMGKSEDWQTKTVNLIQNKELNTAFTIYNPRRLKWDSTWVQSPKNPAFRYQVEWELEKLEQCNGIFMFLDGATKSPISMLELGLFKDRDLFVCVEDDFWRLGNIQIVCERYDIECRVIPAKAKGQYGEFELAVLDYMLQYKLPF